MAKAAEKTGKATKTSKTSKPAVKKAKAVKVEKIVVKIQKPASLPEEFSLNSGVTKAELVTDMNLSGFVFTVNGREVSDSYVFETNDLIRVGVKTKQGKTKKGVKTKKG